MEHKSRFQLAFFNLNFTTREQAEMSACFLLFSVWKVKFERASNFSGGHVNIDGKSLMRLCINDRAKHLSFAQSSTCFLLCYGNSERRLKFV
jgi:hypothetical protein